MYLTYDILCTAVQYHQFSIYRPFITHHLYIAEYVQEYMADSISAGTTHTTKSIT